MIYTSHHPCWDAKNRHNLPEEMDLAYESIAPIFETGTTEPVTQPKTSAAAGERIAGTAEANEPYQENCLRRDREHELFARR